MNSMSVFQTHSIKEAKRFIEDSRYRFLVSPNPQSIYPRKYGTLFTL